MDLPFYNLATRALSQNRLGKMAPMATALDIFTLPPNAVGLSGIDDELMEKLSEARDKTVEEFMMAHFKTEPVKGDEVRLNHSWSLIVRDIDGRGRLRGIGLKNLSDD